MEETKCTWTVTHQADIKEVQVTLHRFVALGNNSFYTWIFLPFKHYGRKTHYVG